jgi:hypothetical protein
VTTEPNRLPGPRRDSRHLIALFDQNIITVLFETMHD